MLLTITKLTLGNVHFNLARSGCGWLRRATIVFASRRRVEQDTVCIADADAYMCGSDSLLSLYFNRYYFGG